MHAGAIVSIARGATELDVTCEPAIVAFTGNNLRLVLQGLDPVRLRSVIISQRFMLAGIYRRNWARSSRTRPLKSPKPS